MRLFNLLSGQPRLTRTEKKNFVALLQGMINDNYIAPNSPIKPQANHPQAGDSIVFDRSSHFFDSNAPWTKQQRQTFADCYVCDGAHYRFKPLYEQYLHDLGWQLDYSFEPAFADYVDQFGWEVCEQHPACPLSVVTRYGLGFRLYC